jgi:hypothetical protein
VYVKWLLQPLTVSHGNANIGSYGCACRFIPALQLVLFWSSTVRTAGENPC